MGDSYEFAEFNDSQRLIYSRVVAAYEARRTATREARRFAGGMHWKTIGGRQYLYRYRDRQGRGQSLGPRSPDTERLWAEFSRDRDQMRTSLADRRRQLQEEARFCRAALLHRVPNPAAAILRRLEEAELLGAKVLVVGAAAIFAYEFAAGAFINFDIGSLRPKQPSRLTLAALNGIAAEELLALLRAGDRSFQPVAGEELVAVNKDRFLVRVLPPKAFRANVATGGAGTAARPGPGEISHFPYLLASPKFSRVVIGKDGMPAPMSAPDPRAFALHKLWLSRQADRLPAKREVDRLQALAVADLILRYLPQYYFFSAELRLFPEELIRRAARPEESPALQGDFEVEY